jgi:copper chaperone NosL
MKKWTLAILFTLTVGILAGCGDKKYEAVPINEEVDVCVICKMQVKDDAFATQLTTTDGKTYKFDDIGCMNEWKMQNGTDTIGMDFVRDYNDKEWIEFSKAAYVYDASLRTPMAYGIVSFKDKTSAEAFITEQGVGKLMSSNDLASHSWEQSTDMMHEHSDGHTADGHMDEDMHSDNDSMETEKSEM